MESLQSLLWKLPTAHQTALQWFIDHAGTVCSWPKPINGILLAAKAKGIYKPAGTKYALSIRQTLKSSYPDWGPVHRPDGTWYYLYHHEDSASMDWDEFFTNRGLLACMEDRVPVGVMRQKSGKPNIQYEILGAALVVQWDSAYFLLEGFSPTGAAQEKNLIETAELIHHYEQELESFDPENIVDARQRVAAAIVRRQGQPAFRQALLRAYDGRCAVSGCEVECVLEAAHILPYRGPLTNHVSNGLLLRSDLHTLFDLGKAAVNGESMTFVLSPALKDSIYTQFNDCRLTLPSHQAEWPSREALEMHRRWAEL